MVIQESSSNEDEYLLHYGRLTVFVGKYYENRNLFYVGFDSDLRYLFNCERGFRKIETAIAYVNNILQKVLMEAVRETFTEEKMGENQ